MLRGLVMALVVMPATARAGDAALDALVEQAPTCDAARAHCFGIQLHVAVTDDAPVTDAAWLARQLAFANRQFAPLDVGWTIVGVDALPASAARVEDAAERSSFGKQVKGTVVHVFVTGQLDDIDKPGGVIYGVTWPRGDTKYVILSAQGWERVLAHELGHVFGLPHSTYAISIMNKTPRDQPPPEERRFADEELAAMKQRLAQIVKSKVLVDVGAPPRPTQLPEGRGL